jgi:hypothetical protein
VLLVTHDGGATWHQRIIGAPLSIGAISCNSAQACRVFTSPFCTPSCSVVTSASTFVTLDGGRTWQEQVPPPVQVSGFACPAIDTCYAVGGMNILVLRRA